MENSGVPVAVHKLYRVPPHHLHSNYGKNSYSYSLVILQNTENLSMRKTASKNISSPRKPPQYMSQNLITLGEPF